MIAIIQYNAGNILSVYNAIDRLGYDCIITNDHKKIKDADKVIFPGVGEAFSAMKYLRSNKLDKLIQNLEQPVLGICLGMQLMCNSSEEGPTKCLKLFPNPMTSVLSPMIMLFFLYTKLTEPIFFALSDILSHKDIKLVL